ncbi:Phosphoglucosamine mutase, partial [Haemophilus influenzae]
LDVFRYNRPPKSL